MSKTPNKDLYEKLKASNKGNASATLVLKSDATWHIVKALSTNEEVAEGYNITEVWRGWEEMLQRTTHKALRSLHHSIFGFVAPTEAKMSKEALCILIWNYRCYHATDHTKPVEQQKANVETPGQRHSAIANRVYKLATPPEGMKKFTSPAGLACLECIKETIQANGGKSCTEGQLKAYITQPEVSKRITPQVDSAWRFLQFYRPQLVDHCLIEYIK